jgi:hypothetical protein
MDLIKLLNFLRKDTEQFPEEFADFKSSYLNDKGEFTRQGTIQFLQQITGYISYLNRENDIRQFAYPIISDVIVPISTTPSTTLYRDIDQLKDQVHSAQESLQEDIPEQIKAIREKHARDKQKCEAVEDRKERASCKKEEMKQYKETLEKAKQKKEIAKEKTMKLKEHMRETKQKLAEFEKSDISQETVLKTDCFDMDRKDI